MAFIYTNIFAALDCCAAFACSAILARLSACPPMPCCCACLCLPSPRLPSPVCLPPCLPCCAGLLWSRLACLGLPDLALPCCLGLRSRLPAWPLLLPWPALLPCPALLLCPGLPCCLGLLLLWPDLLWLLHLPDHLPWSALLLWTALLHLPGFVALQPWPGFSTCWSACLLSFFVLPGRLHS